MDLLLNKQEQQLLKNVLHALYKSFRLDPGMNIGTCRVVDVSSENLKTMIDIHDRIVAAELAEEQENKTELDKALDYVRENMDEDDMAILHAEMNKCYKMHLIPDSDTMDCTKVIDLLEEYGDDNELPEGWWEEYGDIDDILLKL